MDLLESVEHVFCSHVPQWCLTPIKDLGPQICRLPLGVQNMIF